MSVVWDLAIAIGSIAYLDCALFQGLESPILSLILILAAAIRIATSRRREC